MASPFSLFLPRMNKLRFFFGVSTIAWAVGFAKMLGATENVVSIGSYQYNVTPFPVWPNILDVIGLISVGCFLLFEMGRHAK